MDFKIKKRLYTTLTIILFVPLISSNVISPNETITLTIEVDNLRNSDGIVQFALYNTKGSIPDEKYTKYFKLLKADIKNNTSKVTFENIPIGKYAVNVFHDENKNGKIDKGWIFPNEGIGFSNFQSLGFSNIPSFEKASFNLQSNKKIQVKIIYM